MARLGLGSRGRRTSSSGGHRQSLRPVWTTVSIRRSIEHVYDGRARVRTRQGPARTNVRTTPTRRADTPFEQMFEHRAPAMASVSPWPRRDGPRAARRAARRHRAHPAPAAGARHDQGRDREARLPAQHARDRRGGRADQLLQRRPPAQGARGEGLPQARPQPAAGARGVPARGDGRTALARLAPRSRRSTRPASATPVPPAAYVPLLGRIAAGGPILAEETLRGGLPAAQARWSARAAVPARGLAATRWSTRRSATATTS